MSISFLCSTLSSNIILFPNFDCLCFGGPGVRVLNPLLFDSTWLSRSSFFLSLYAPVLGISKFPKGKKHWRNSRSPQCLTFLFCFPESLCPPLLSDAFKQLFFILFCLCLWVLVERFVLYQPHCHWKTPKFLFICRYVSFF